MQDELAKGRSNNVEPALEREAIAKFEAIIREWGLKMPVVDPIVIDFGMQDFYRYGLIEYWVANEMQAGYCGKLLFVFDGQTCPRHYHKVKKETFYVIKGRMELELEGRLSILNPGDVATVETEMDHMFTGVGPVLILEVSMPSIIDDNYFEDPRVPYGRRYEKAARA